MCSRRALILLCIAAGCGKHDAGLADAGLADAGLVDAEVADAAPRGPVQVTTFSRCCIDAPGERVPGIEIIVVEPDGSIETAETDSVGEATVDLSAGASVTAFYAGAYPNSALSTVIGVTPGDHLVFGKSWRRTLESSIGTMTFDWPPDAGLYRVDAYHACGSDWGDGAAGTTSNLFYPSCAGAFDDVVFVGRDSNWSILDWAVVTGQTFTDGGTVTLPAWQAPVPLAMSVTGLPSEITHAALQADMMIDGSRTYNNASLPDNPSGGAVSGSVPWAPMGDALQVSAVIERWPAALGAQYVYVTRPPETTAVAIADPITMPWMSNVAVSSTDLSWELDGTGDWDATRLEYYYWRGVANSEYYQWSILVPPGVNHVTLPPLPANLQAVAPAPGDTNSVSGALFDLGDVAGYDDARARPEWDFPDRYWLGAVPDGLIKISGGPTYE